LSLDDEQLSRAFALWAWTRALVPGVVRLGVTVAGSPLDLPGEGADSAVSGWSEYTPAVAWASQSLFGVRDGRVVAVASGEERRISGPMGSLDLGIRKIAVDLPGERVAATTDAGEVLVGPRSRVPGTEPRPDDVQEVYDGGTGLLAPAWDLFGQLWLVDNGPAGARISLFAKGSLDEIDVEGMTGADIRAFVMSRDGTRLAAVVDDGDQDHLVLSRVARSASGRVRSVTPARRIPVAALGVTRVRDLAWRTPGSLALLTAPTADTSQVVVVKVDGSSTVSESTTDAETYRGRASRLVTSPVLGAPLYIRAATG
ncbi:MAG: LpqB family beta-propeller domain-containing protein, partial [Nocardioides sp.]